MSAPNLTEKEFAALKFVADMIDGGLPPTLEEIGQVLRMTKQGASTHVESLERKGCIVRAPRAARHIRLTKTGRRLSRATATSSDVSVVRTRSA